MTHKKHDIVVVGAGSGGFAAARTARDLGADVALVDPGPLGGLCILRGCMPSKTLIATSDLMQEIREAETLGVGACEPQVDYRAVIERKRRVIKGFADYRIENLETFELLHGAARFVGPRDLLVGDTRVRAKNIVV